MIIDFTEIMLAIVAGVFSILGPVAAYWFQQHVKDQQAAQVIQNAVHNALGAIQQAAERGIRSSHQVGVSYVLDHAGEEAARLGISSAAIADKISAQIGLQHISTNAAIAASPLPLAPKPLDPVPNPDGSQNVASFVALSPQQG